ncbi:hypothetical protein CBR_g66796 [Chara braunii]|uniref:Uncharacterized protein n=1 Tax=Chara braunii TaxID=69332 RepID=A0A388K9G0_CHABU|nr:hypothetical protein CBR_g66796 [Chara braunii]|eukprot:GBG66661.1 hypothetical protein CBR_g66796 [Chara braunii]
MQACLACLHLSRGCLYDNMMHLQMQRPWQNTGHEMLVEETPVHSWFWMSTLSGLAKSHASRRILKHQYMGTWAAGLTPQILEARNENATTDQIYQRRPQRLMFRPRFLVATSFGLQGWGRVLVV